MKMRLAEIRTRIAVAAATRGRRAEDITLVAVSKMQPVSAIMQARALGLCLFGENYAQELRDKAAEVQGVQWHFIGRFQKNKINMLKDTVRCFQTISSIDDGQALAQRVGDRVEAMLQVNISREPQKGGFDPDAVLGAVKELSALTLTGLMCIPAAGRGPEGFQALAALAKRVEDALGRKMALSMGMSDDFETAIHHGATHVRIGSLLFGPRPPVQ